MKAIEIIEFIETMAKHGKRITIYQTGEKIYIDITPAGYGQGKNLQKAIKDFEDQMKKIRNVKDETHG